VSDLEASGPLRVLYDEECGLCRRLAEYGRTRSEGRLDFVSWQQFAVTDEAGQYFSDAERAAPPAHLRTLREGEIHEDDAAWALILAAYPPFERFAWMVERLGMMGPVSRATYHGAQWLRQRCGPCP
jgi:predicted DCC family thiol-disulfide oxidoreductase YuxK